MQPISKFIFCSLNITVKMLIMTKVGQKIVGYIRKAYFDANFSFATYTLQVSTDLQYIIKIYLFRNIFIVTLITVGNSSLNFFFLGGEIHKINCGPTCFDNKQTFFLGQMFSSISNVCADGCYIVIVITNNFIGKILLFNIECTTL